MIIRSSRSRHGAPWTSKDLLGLLALAFVSVYAGTGIYSSVAVYYGDDTKPSNTANPVDADTDTDARQQELDETKKRLYELEAKQQQIGIDKQFLSCLQNVLWKELPIANGKDKGTTKDVVFAHHGDAGHWQIWNHHIDKVFKGLTTMDAINRNAATAEEGGENVNGSNKVKKCSIWEVGANTAADDSRTLMKLYGNCEYHAFEPVPNFNEQLLEVWKDEKRMKIHQYGIGATEAKFYVTAEDLQGQGTFLMDASGGDTSKAKIEIEIKTFDTALSQSSGIPDMVQMNCEGCEWTVLPEAIQHGWLKKVPVIQVGWHSYGKIGLGARSWQTCEIRQMLEETHTMDYGLAFGWERWLLKTE
eukprot:scaffold6907_cov124-Chaetoceros_neogracile.AAC.1